ncbi:3-isopropylmalate dehydratase large subunit [Sesbania bispinosa]|nr:3-isopropylmalate dehydratase large subunit [Sesbania bispinosa]
METKPKSMYKKFYQGYLPVRAPEKCPSRILYTSRSQSDNFISTSTQPPS